MDTTRHLVCPACHTVNRVSEPRLGDGPRCGSCQKPLFTGRPVELDAASFDKHIERNDLLVVVDFWAAWCGPCRSMAPHFERAATELEPGVRFAKLDTEAAPEIAARYGIRAIPTLIVFQHGRETARRSGALDSRSLVDWLRPIAGAAVAARESA
jgi:thioredoxin 2